MNASAIYSKSGKGVQEASGKTSHLSRPDRAVLSAIDGRATLADVAQKVGKSFDPAFVKLIETLDKSGFIREVSPGAAAPGAKPGAAAPAKPAAKPAGPVDPASDLDFTTIMSTPKAAAKAPPPPPQAPPRAAPPPPKPTATIPPPPPPPSADEKAKAERIAREQQEAFVKAREEAERKAQADRDRVKAEAEAKMRAETEAKMRAEAKAEADKKFAAELEAKANADAEAKIKAAREAAARAAAEAKAKADAEARKAREEADRIRKEAEEKAEQARKEAERARKEAEEQAARARKEAEEQAARARKEAEEKARREQEELRRKLEEERKAREEAERKAKEEAKRIEEERRKLDEERKAREEERRREEEERAARRKAEDEEEKERKRKKREAEEEEERREAAERAERKKREQEEDERREAEERAEREAKRRAKQQAEEEEEREEAERAAARKAKEKDKPKEKEREKEPAPAAAKPAGGGFSDTLLADLESFTTRDEEEQKEREEALRKEKEAAAQRAREAEERRQKEEAERLEREEKERRKREAAEQKAREEAELREREEREKQRLKEEEEKRKEEAEERARKAKQEERLAASAERRTDTYSEQASMRSRRERELAAKPRAMRERAERKGGWGKPIAITLFLLILIGLGVAHVVPIDTTEYQTAASEAFRRPVKIGSANLSLFTGLQIKFNDVSIGDAKFGQVRAHPSFDSLTGPRKTFSLVELEGIKLPQEAVGEALFIRMKGDNFSVGRIVARKLELVGPLTLPKELEGDLSFDGEGMLRHGFLRGPETLVAKFAPKGQAVEFDMSAGSFTVPFAPEIAFSQFAMKGSATPQGVSIAEWDGQTLSGTLSGTANVRWGDTWQVDGVVTARNINAAVFAPALISDGRGEGSGKFQMRGEPGKLAETSRIDGSFTINRGVLGSIDLSRAIQTQGRFATGRTQFNEMNGQATYDRGAVTLRNITIGAGQLNAGASAEIAQNGALSGRIVADVKVAQQQLRATLNLGGTLKDPQVKN